jgi:hypothetical protein
MRKARVTNLKIHSAADIDGFNRSLAMQLADTAAERAEREREEAREDAAAAVLKAYNELDRSLMKVVDEHIERVRRSQEANAKRAKKLLVEKEMEKRREYAERMHDEAAIHAQELRDFLRMRRSGV